MHCSDIQEKDSIEVPSFLCSVTRSSCILVSSSVAIWNGPWRSLSLSCVLEALLGCLWVFISCFPKLRDKNNELYFNSLFKDWYPHPVSTNPFFFLFIHMFDLQENVISL